MEGDVSRWAGGSDDGLYADLIGSLGRNIVGSRTCNNSHGRDDHDHIEPNREIGQMSKLCEGSNLSEQHASDAPYETEDDEACTVLVKLGTFGSHLRQTLTVGDDDDTDIEEKLERLKEIDRVSCDRAVCAEGNVAVSLQGVAVGVQAKEHLPQQVSTTDGCQYSSTDLSETENPLASEEPEDGV